MSTEEFEGEGLAYGTVALPPKESIRQLGAVLLDKAATEPKPGMRAEFGLLSEAYGCDELQSPLHLMFEQRPTMNPLYAAQFLLRNKRFIEHLAGSSADDTASLQQLLAGNPGVFRRNLLSRDITTTKAHRIKATAVALQACGIEDCTVVDLGAGQNHNLVMLALAPSEGFQYTPTEVGRLAVVKAATSGDQPQKRVLIADPEQTAAFGSALSQPPLRLRYGLGIDQNDPHDPDNDIWSQVCSVTADEASNEARAEFQRLSAARPKNVGTMAYVDMAYPLERVAFAHRKQKLVPEAPKRFSAALFSFSLYQLKSLEQRRTAIQNAMDLTKKKAGKIFILDAVRIASNGSMYFKDNRRPNAVTLNMYDKANEQAGWQRLLTASDGRISQVALEPAFGQLPRAEELGLMPLEPARRGQPAARKN